MNRKRFFALGFHRANLDRAALGLCVVLLSVSCATHRPSASEHGIASWYGQDFQGRKTANGERFDARAMTAAHPSLPFGTRVRVRNLANQKEVIVRINDRGPYAKNRIIDLSREAARRLGMLTRGEAEVEIFTLGD